MNPDIIDTVRAAHEARLRRIRYAEIAMKVALIGVVLVLVAGPVVVFLVRRA